MVAGEGASGCHVGHEPGGPGQKQGKLGEDGQAEKRGQGRILSGVKEQRCVRTRVEMGSQEVTIRDRIFKYDFRRQPPL